MSKPRFVIVGPDGLGPHVAELRALERDIHYPIDDGNDHFSIDHGPDYHPFFSMMGDRARFLLVIDGDRVVGSLAGVWRASSLADDVLPSLYLADLKLAPAYRGRGLVSKMLWHGLRKLPFRKDFQGWRFAYAAAMRGDRGDIMRSVHGANPAGVSSTCAQMVLFFASADALSGLPGFDPPPPPLRPGLDLSPASPDAPLVISTAGRKDLRLISSGAAWPLVHLNRAPSGWGRGGLSAYLRRCATLIDDHHRGALACFALDQRLRGHIDWLDRNGVAPGALCTIYGLHLRVPFLPAARRAPWAHIATSDI